jgi:hypothetical protein
MSLNLSYKTQWDSEETRPYKTTYITYEEAMPCQVIDYGLRFLYDEEGDGILQTWEIGGMVAGSITGFSNQFDEHNLRIGASFAWRQHKVDFTRLRFSDQLDPKYGFQDEHGIPIPTAFVPPEDNSSRVYFNPAIGMIWRSIWATQSPRGILMNIGVSAQNLLNLSASVLDDDEYQSWRLTFHAEAEFVPISRHNNFVTVRPMILYQNQGNIDYIELGAQSGLLNNGLIFGAYLHSNSANGFVNNTNWYTLNASFNVPLHFNRNDKSLLQLGFSYSDNINKLKNFFGPQFQIGLSFNFATSPVCNLMGQPNPFGALGPCPIWQVSPAKRKIYENVWYDN